MCFTGAWLYHMASPCSPVWQVPTSVLECSRPPAVFLEICLDVTLISQRKKNSVAYAEPLWQSML